MLYFNTYITISNNLILQDQVSAGIYFKTIGKRQGLSVAESDVNFANLTNQQKQIYRDQALLDITKLTAEGYIRIGREELDVTIIAEKADL